ncbi:sugar transferase [Pseudooceanicola aestuarii]|uniref:sugar transferase n=1 Tax=Pseudooceanicola aestuarii TaxID=2697319 RepID=UPI0013D8005A|nr:sugar transferase [Pseudooceanicola aestuarii]
MTQISTTNLAGQFSGGLRLADFSTPAERASRDRAHGPWAKALFDRAFAAVALILALPIMAAVAAVLLVTDGRPLVYGHRRIGRDGTSFVCWKFRTMVVDADARLEEALASSPEMRAEWEARRKLTNDPRLNAVGALLRRTSLDELPQFWNVLRGDMAMVGPRPITRSELAYYGLYVTDYTSVRPGLTGAWQIGGRSDTSYAARVAMDVKYVRGYTFMGDLVIILRTVRAVAGMIGAR